LAIRDFKFADISGSLFIQLSVVLQVKYSTLAISSRVVLAVVLVVVRSEQLIGCSDE
jgi:hypothetical protein